MPGATPTDPDFEATAADVIGGYLDPPTHAVVFRIDETTATRALDRRPHRSGRIRLWRSRSQLRGS